MHLHGFHAQQGAVKGLQCLRSREVFNNAANWGGTMGMVIMVLPSAIGSSAVKPICSRLRPLNADQ
jgi:hypothetical protein